MNFVIPGYIRAALDHPENGRVYADLMESEFLPEEEKFMHLLYGEGFNFLLAGTETTAVRRSAYWSNERTRADQSRLR